MRVYGVRIPCQQLPRSAARSIAWTSAVAIGKRHAVTARATRSLRGCGRVVMASDYPSSVRGWLETKGESAADPVLYVCACGRVHIARGPFCRRPRISALRQTACSRRVTRCRAACRGLAAVGPRYSRLAGASARSAKSEPLAPQSAATGVDNDALRVSFSGLT
ncbi:hypothetical protein MRX96_039199 [Rhipicephalus microplus]